MSTPHNRYQRYRCRDCEGFPAGVTASSVCSITSKVKRPGDAICVDGRIRKGQTVAQRELAPSDRGGSVKKYQCPTEGCTFDSDTAHGLKVHGSRTHKTPGAKERILGYIAEVDGQKQAEKAPADKHDCTTCAHEDVEPGEQPCDDCKQFDGWEDPSVARASATASAPSDEETEPEEGAIAAEDFNADEPVEERACTECECDVPCESNQQGVCAAEPVWETCADRLDAGEPVDVSERLRAYELNRFPRDEKTVVGIDTGRGKDATTISIFNLVKDAVAQQRAEDNELLVEILAGRIDEQGQSCTHCRRDDAAHETRSASALGAGQGLQGRRSAADASDVRGIK